MKYRAIETLECLHRSKLKRYNFVPFGGWIVRKQYEVLANFSDHWLYFLLIQPTIITDCHQFIPSRKRPNKTFRGITTKRKCTPQKANPREQHLSDKSRFPFTPGRSLTPTPPAHVTCIFQALNAFQDSEALSSQWSRTDYLWNWLLEAIRKAVRQDP